VAGVIAAPPGEHPAPWPLRDLDVAAARKAGHQPVPFRQFILKVHSRCNLACSYCYVYEMADQAWQHLPRRMSDAVAGQAVERIAEHAKTHGLDSVDVILHGGEPLLAQADWLAGLIDSLRLQVPAQVNVSMQTNGTLLTRPVLETLKSRGVMIGVSLDGDAEATGRYRLYPSGRNSFGAVSDGLHLLQSPEYRDCYGGVLCTIDTGNDPVATYETLLEFCPPALDLLLPHANWDCPPPGRGYAQWLIRVFDRWYSAPRQETEIRLFRELIQLVLGQPGGVEGLGLLPSTLVVIDTDGSVKQLDSLSSAYPGAADTGLHVLSGSFDDALDHPTTVARQLGAAALSPQCQACEVMEICGGGLYPHRYRQGSGFRNPSAYCADLLELIGHVRGRVVRDLSRLSGLYHRLNLRGQAFALRRFPGIGMLQRQRVGVPAERLGTPEFRPGPVSRGRLVDGEVRGRHEGVGVLVAERLAALSQRFRADLDRLAEPAARGEIGGVVDTRGQRERVPVTVDPDQAPAGLVVIGEGSVRIADHAEHGREVQLSGIEDVVGRAGPLATVVGLAREVQGAGQVADGAEVVDQVSGGNHREHVISA
jgi:uncharacterized protein